MKYDARDANSVIPEGEYQATIKAFYDKDNDGRPLMNKARTEAKCNVLFEVYADNGTRTVTQSFSQKATLFLYKQLAHALGQAEAFKANTFTAADHIGDGVTLVAKVKFSEQYGDQNQFSFKPKLANAAAPARGKATPDTPITDDSIPF